MPPAKTATKVKYLVNVGISYQPNRNAEPGDIVDDLPGADIQKLLEEGTITPVAKAPAQDGE